MKKLLTIFKNYYSKAFRERKLLVVSGDRVNTITLSGRLQAGVVSFILIASLFGPLAVSKIFQKNEFQQNALMQDIGDANQRMRIIEQNIDSLEGYFRAIKVNGNFQLKDQKNRKMPEITMKEFNDKDQLAVLEARQKMLMAQLYVDVYGRIENLEDIIKSSGYTYKSLVGKEPPNRAVGGPFIPAKIDVDETEFKELFYSDDFAEDFRYLYNLQYIVNNMPYMSPINRPKITSRFGLRYDPFTRSAAFHAGVDLAAGDNALVYASAPGKVTFAGREGAYGNMVEIQHNLGGLSTRYGHLKRLNVREGQKVNRGDVIGIQGSTGRSTGDHLHYEVRINDKPANPAKFINQAYKIRYYYENNAKNNQSES